MWRITLPIVSLFLPLAAQTPTPAGATITGAGYQAPRAVLVAPGQVVHLKVHGLTTVFNSVITNPAPPLTTSFYGMSVTIQRTGGTPPEAVPLLGVESIATCTASVPASTFSLPIPCSGDNSSDIWLQIPFDLVPNGPGSDQTCPAAGCNPDDAVLTINEISGSSLNLRVLPVTDQVHILNSCTDNIGTAGVEGTSVFASYACVPAITHGDNSWVTAANPAKPGEELIAYAFGLGAPVQIFDAVGETPAGGVALAKPFGISFPGIASTAGGRLDYVGLVGGNPGLYQVNFHVPSVPALTPCTVSTSPTQLAITPFNITMALQGTASVDQVSFCVKP